MAWRSNLKRGMYAHLGHGAETLIGDQEAKQFNKMHAFTYGVKKAGMEDVDEGKMA